MLLAIRILWDWLCDRKAWRVLYNDGSVSACLTLRDAKDLAYADGRDRIVWDASHGR
jgi:hypothetical protein